MVCWNLRFTTSMRPAVPASAGYRCPRTFRKEGRRYPSLGSLENARKSTSVLFCRD